MLLNIPAYKHTSKIRETMGKSLEELASIGYVSKWDIRPMSTKSGYKLVLEPGEEVLRVLALSQRKQVTDGNDAIEQLSPSQEDALKALSEKGVSPAKANSLVRNHDSETIIDQIEYAEFVMSRDKRNKIQNPAGFIIYTIENGIPVPTDFVISRRRREQEEQHATENDVRLQQYRLEMEYDEFVYSEVDHAIAEQFPGDELTRKIKEMIRERRRADERFELLSATQQSAMVKQLFRHDMKDKVKVPSFEDWRKSREQIGLFST